MRKSVSFLAIVVLAGLLTGGCANAQKKLSRGISNMGEIVRLGEFRRASEQSVIFGGSDVAYAGGFVTGISRSLARTGLGIYEVITFPIPSYDPIWTNYLTPGPVFPDNYAPGILEDAMYSTDVYTGFSGGDLVPMIPGSRFRVFDEH